MWLKLQSGLLHFIQWVKSSLFTAQRWQTYLDSSITWALRYCKIPYRTNLNSHIYIVLGNSECGKSSMLNNIALHYLNENELDLPRQQLKAKCTFYQLWFNATTTFIEVNLKSDLTSTQSWKSLAKTLRNNRRNKPLNGLILCYSAIELIINSPAQRYEFFCALQHYLSDLQDVLHTQIPIYLVLTKTDQVQGFSEFFSDLSQEELTQVWGITDTLPLEVTSKQSLPFFQNGFNELYQNLMRRLLWTLERENDLTNREYLAAFPEQFRLLHKPLLDFIEQLLPDYQQFNLVNLRGCYFTSSAQSHTGVDLIANMIGTEVVQSQQLVQLPHKIECYFLQSLFHAVVLPEAKYLGTNIRTIKRHKFLHRISYWAIPSAAVLISSYFFAGYLAFAAGIPSTQTKLSYASTLAENLTEPQAKIANALALFDTLHSVHARYSSLAPNQLFLLAYLNLQRQSKAALQRSLKSYLLPGLAAQLEEQLRFADNSDPNIIYALLKGYLAFSPHHPTDAPTLYAPAMYLWALQGVSPTISSKLHYYLTVAAQHKIPDLPLDRTLIQRLLNQLDQLDPAERGYAMLLFKSISSQVPELNLCAVTQSEQQNVFYCVDPTLAIHPLHTRQGQKILRQQLRFVASQVAKDGIAIGLNNQDKKTFSLPNLMQRIEKIYLQHLQQDWLKNLSNLRIQPIENITQAQQQLLHLNNSKSPLNQLLNSIEENSTPAFAELNKFTNNQTNPVKYTTILKILSQLQAYLQRIEQNTNPENAMYLATANYMQADSTNPLWQLDQLIPQTPKLIQPWLQQISNNVWHCLSKGSLQSLNRLWSEQVLAEYEQYLSHHYPLQQASNSYLSIDAFNHFFSPAGTLADFYKKWLQPFVNENTTSWQAKNYNHHSLPLQPITLAMLQRAQIIQHQFFNTNNSVSKINFIVQPVTLSSNAATIQLNLGAVQIKYQHGPLLKANFSWPYSDNTVETKAILTNFSNDRFVYTGSGPWSLFQFFHQYGLTQSNNPGKYFLNIHCGGMEAAYILYTDADMATLNLTALTGYILPNTL